MDGLTIIEGHARFERPDVVRVDESLLRAPRIFINVGGRANVPNMPSIGTDDYLTNTTILELDLAEAYGYVNRTWPNSALDGFVNLVIQVNHPATMTR